MSKQIIYVDKNSNLWKTNFTAAIHEEINIICVTKMKTSSLQNNPRKQ